MAEGEQPWSLQVVVPRGLGEPCDSQQDSQGTQATSACNGFGELSQSYQKRRQGVCVWGNSCNKMSQATKPSTYHSIKWDIWTSTDEAEPEPIGGALSIEAKEGEANCI